MKNEIEYQIYFEIIENLKDVYSAIKEYSKDIEYAISASKSFESTATTSFRNISNGIISYTDSLLSIASNVYQLELFTKAQKVCNNAVTLGQRALYVYQVQVLLARTAIASTTGATKAMNIAIAASPYLIAAAAAVTLGVAIYKLSSAHSDAAQSQKRLDEAMTEMNKEVTVEQVKLDTLFEPLNRAKEGTEEWNRAKDKIVSQYGDYLNKMGIEIKDVKTAREAYKKLSQSILDTARSRALESVTSKAAESYAEKEVEGLKKIRERLYKEAASGGEITFSEAGKAFGQIKAAIRGGKDIPAESKAILDKFQKTWRDLDGNVYQNNVAFLINKQIDELRSSRSVYENEISKANALLGGSTVFKPSVKTDNSPEDDPDEENLDVKPAKNSIADLENSLSAEKKKQTYVPVEMGVQIQVNIENLEEQLAKAKMVAQFGEPLMVPLTFQAEGKAMEALNQFQKNLEEGAEDTDITPRLELPTTLPQLTEGFNSYANSVQNTADNLNMTQDGLGMTSSLMNNLSGVVGEGAAGWLGYGANILSSVAQAIPALAQVVGGNIAQAFSGAAAQSQTVPFPLNIIALATSLAAVGAAVAQIPAFAAGGIAFGPTFGLFGEYSGARNNPEVVAPLNRLRSLLQPAGMEGGEVNFRIRDRYLEGVLQRRNNRIRRTR